jgi:hypothetical protein
MAGTRPNMTEDLDVRQQYLSLVYYRAFGDAPWTMVNQGRTLSPEQTADEKEFARIGDKNKVKVPGTIATAVTLQLFVDTDLSEIGAVLGVPRPNGGWEGTERLELDPSQIGEFQIENYDGAVAGATLKFVENIYRFKPAKLAMALEAEGDARYADLSGSADAYYITPEAE